MASPADIAIYGGAAGGGKTWALEFEPLRHVDKPGFSAVIFRRNAVQVRNPGGLWDASMKIYPGLKATPLSQPMEWLFPSKAKIKFAHLDHETTVLDWQGAEIALICFDELTHFSESQFFYMLSRNRSTCGVRPYVRATCNPDADSWVANFISWWIDQETGLAIPERSGQIRWMIRLGDKIVWADSPDELKREYGDESLPKSVTFIASSLFDNKILMEADPGYLANLKGLSVVERERLLGGNWKIRPAAGLYFQRAWCPVVEAAPTDLQLVRYWDLAATEKIESNDPDFTVSVKMGRSKADGRIYILHCLSMRQSPFQVKSAVINIAGQDGRKMPLVLPQDPGQAGKAQARDFVRALYGYRVLTRPESGDKVTRFGPFSAQCEAGNVAFVRGEWNEELFTALEGFPAAPHDDHADACSGAYNFLTEKRPPMRFSRGGARR
ncbi:MAG: phage terminase large subunit [Candidatus Adiutrix sp.]|nr:phage terminase large subunit [Candidatus Adiutrix sp.]